MSCNLSVSESLLLWRALAFSACTCLLDPLSHGRLPGYGGSGIFAAGGAETGRSWYCGCMATCFRTAIRCCWSLKLTSHHGLLKGPRYAARKRHECVVCQGLLV